MKENSKMYDETLERARFFQTIQAWPLSEELNYDGWLNNFNGEDEKKIAGIILDFFIYYSPKMVNQMLKESVSKAGHLFNKYYPDWKHDYFTEKCIYSLIPGENRHNTDSGYLFTRKLRDELRVPKKYILDYSEIPTYLQNQNTPIPILFVDDFVGTGIQTNVAWNTNKIDGTNTLSELISMNNHCAVYAPLIVNEIGQKLILERCKGLHLCATHIIGNEYNLFKKECICWNGDEALYEKGTNLIIAKSLEQGIPKSWGLKTIDIKGYHEQGLAIAFEHGVPDAVAPFFYWETATWTPLKRKAYLEI